MAYARFQATITDEAGNIIPNANVEVRIEDNGGLAPVFSDRDGLAPLGNPFTADAEGYAYFHAPGGAYRIRAYLDTFDREWRYVPVGLAAETDDLAEGAVISPDLSVTAMVALTQAAYDLLSPPDPTTFYVIVDA